MDGEWQKTRKLKKKNKIRMNVSHLMNEWFELPDGLQSSVYIFRGLPGR